MAERKILCVDLRSFFASVECADAGFDIYEVPLVVADRSRGEGGITLAVTPYLKEKGATSRCRIYELPKGIDIIYAKPRMARYVEVSTEIISIYLDYVSEEDLHIYSIDEAFLDVTNYLEYHKQTEWELAHTIQAHILKQTKIHSTCGIGPNMLIAKLALDLDSKKSKTGICKWTYDDIKTRLWPVKPLSKVWGIGPRLEKRLNALKIYNVYDLAHTEISILEKHFGVYGKQLYYHSHGIDHSSMQSKHEYEPKSTSIGHGQTLYFDHDASNVRQIILELSDRVAKRLRKKEKVGTVIHLSIGYSKAVSGGFSRQLTIDYPTDSPNEINKVCSELFDKHYDGKPIRKVSISVGHLMERNVVQMDLFGIQAKYDRERRLLNAMDDIHEWYGKNAILRASHFKDSSTMRERNKLIGGHRA
ncbi:hypothetical protein RI065_04555 [Mycoplasmatota bacterium zrk1]